MGKEFEKVDKILSREFGKNRKLYMATSLKNVPMVKIVSTCYWNGSFYLVAHESSETVQRIKKNRNVSLCSTASFHKFQGEAINIGHPLSDDNKEIRGILKKASKAWYDEQIEESDPAICLVQVKVNTAFTYANKIGYNVDFRKYEILSSRFAPND